MFILLKIINVLRLSLNVLTFLLFMDYFEMQGLPTADETAVFAGLMILFVPTVLLWVFDFVIYSRGQNQKRNQYLSILANAHFISLFLLNYFIGGVCKFFFDITLTGTVMMTLTFCFLIIGFLTNVYLLFFVKRTSLKKEQI